jgi:hypothetical protein
VLNWAILVIRCLLDTVPRRSDLDALSTPPDTRYSAEFRMECTDMNRGTSYLNPERHKLLAEHLKKATGIGRKPPLLR